MLSHRSRFQEKKTLYFAMRGVQKGFAAFEGCLQALREQAPHWHLRLLRSVDLAPEVAAADRGLIIQGFIPDAARLLRDVWPGPAVVVHGDPAEFGQGQYVVSVDDGHYGAEAARHLLGLGLRDMLAIFPAAGYWPERRQSFAQTFEAGGGGIREYFDNFGSLDCPEFRKLVREMPRPCGVFVYRPEVGAEVMRVCREQGLSVPEDVGVLTGNDHPVLSYLEAPALTGISENDLEIGRRACEVLIGLMSGQTPEPRVQQVRVKPVITRGSTDCLYCADTQVTKALRILHGALPDRRPMGEVARMVGLSLNQLERRALTALGMTLQEKRQRLQVARAMELLTHGSAPISEVAQLAGFHDNAHLSRAMRRFQGKTPRQVRGK